MAAPSFNFQLIINNALKVYHKRTKNDLILHPLAAQLQTCNSPTDILALLREPGPFSKVTDLAPGPAEGAKGLNQSRSGEDRWTKWLDPTIMSEKVRRTFIGPSYFLRDGWNCWPGMPKDMRLSEICTYLTGILTLNGNLCWNQRSPFGAYHVVGYSNTYGSQAAKNVCAS